jgi:Holliday junction resolvase RusA-like endonuclease
MTDTLFSPETPGAGAPARPGTLPAGAPSLAPAGRPAIVITAYGVPGPQGSKRHVGKGVMVESSKKVKPWREAVKYAALEQITAGRIGSTDVHYPPLDGPLVVEFCFTLQRPKSAPKSRVHPDRMPDLSKLIRSTEDALTDAGVWTDDARLVAYHQPRKVYTGSADPDALHAPGAVIRIWPAVSA